MYKPFGAAQAAIALLVAADAAAEPPPVEAFGRLPVLRNVDVSPDGTAFSAKVAVGGSEHVAVYGLTPDGLTPLFAAKENDTLRVNWIHWKRDDRLVVSLRFPSKRYGTETVETRLYGLDRDGGELKSLFNNKRDETPLQIEDNIVSWLPTDPEHILVEYNRNDPREPGVYKVPIDGGLHRNVQTSRTNVSSWLADHQGRVRAGFGRKGREETKPHLNMRVADDGRWIDFSDRLAEEAPYFNVLGFAPDGKTAYVESSHEKDPPPVYEFDIETNTFGKIVFEHEAVEVSRLRFTPRSGELIGVSFVDDDSHTVWLDKQIEAELAQVRNMLSGKYVRLTDFSIDGARAVLFVAAPDDAGRYYFLNRSTMQLTQMPPNYPELEGVALGKVVATRYLARDGLSIPAYVTLPPGVASLEEARGIPFIVNPHGGPAARDFRRFDYWAQFFASRGYGVLQMNFRGSAGYGAAFQSAGHRQWGQAMQDDITDSVHWLIAEGLADKNRIAIVGGSYGGYAALMGAVKTPDLYQCAISFAGVTDLPDLIRDARRYIGGKAGARHIGRLWQDRSMLAENSPARRAEDIKIPVLLLHGDKDRVVDVDHSKKMRRAMERAGGAVKYIEFKNGDHYLSAHADRVAFLAESERFLSGCLAP